LFIKDSSLYIYADDNTLSFVSPDFDLLISTLESDSNHLIEWFKINKMQANPDKFQALAVGKKTYEKRPTINIQNFVAVWHVVGNQKPLKGPSELMLYNVFCRGLHANLLEV
jgi:hypothetical protein